jgi:acetyl esterase
MTSQISSDAAKALAVLEAHAALSGGPTPTLEQRRFRHEFQTTRLTPPTTRQRVASVNDRIVDGPQNQVPVRVYLPAERPALRCPTFVWIHGGGWVTGSLETADGIAREACAAGFVVVSVDYRLAPEHPFPAGLDDCLTVLAWVRSTITELGGDPRRIAVGGDSAGGNLAAVVAQQARRAEVDVAGQMLLYPVMDADMTTDDYPSRAEFADGPLLSMDDLHWLVSHYTSGSTDSLDPQISPLRSADLTGVAPAVVVTAASDPLRDEGEAYAAALSRAGVVVRTHQVADAPHGVFDMLDAVPSARTALQRALADMASLMPEPISVDE